MVTTKSKESAAVKGKRGTSPSSSQANQHNKDRTHAQMRPRSRSSSPDRKETSNASRKPLPNYLKPTISSLGDPSKQFKKHGSQDSKKSSEILRRGSLDRPTINSFHDHTKRVKKNGTHEAAQKSKILRRRSLDNHLPSCFTKSNSPSKPLFDKTSITSSGGAKIQSLPTKTVKNGTSAACGKKAKKKEDIDYASSSSTARLEKMNGEPDNEENKKYIVEGAVEDVKDVLKDGDHEKELSKIEITDNANALECASGNDGSEEKFSKSNVSDQVDGAERGLKNHDGEELLNSESRDHVDTVKDDLAKVYHEAASSESETTGKVDNPKENDHVDDVAESNNVTEDGDDELSQICDVKDDDGHNKIDPYEIGKAPENLTTKEAEGVEGKTTVDAHKTEDIQEVECQNSGIRYHVDVVSSDKTEEEIKSNYEGNASEKLTTNQKDEAECGVNEDESENIGHNDQKDKLGNSDIGDRVDVVKGEAKDDEHEDIHSHEAENASENLTANDEKEGAN